LFFALLGGSMSRVGARSARTLSAIGVVLEVRAIKEGPTVNGQMAISAVAEPSGIWAAAVAVRARIIPLKAPVRRAPAAVEEAAVLAVRQVRQTMTVVVVAGVAVTLAVVVVVAAAAPLMEPVDLAEALPAAAPVIMLAAAAAGAIILPAAAEMAVPLMPPVVPVAVSVVQPDRVQPPVRVVGEVQLVPLMPAVVEAVVAPTVKPHWRIRSFWEEEAAVVVATPALVPREVTVSTAEASSSSLPVPSRLIAPAISRLTASMLRSVTRIAGAVAQVRAEASS